MIKQKTSYMWALMIKESMKRLDNMIDYSLFQGNAVIGFENLGKQKLILHAAGLSILNHKRNHKNRYAF
jgi:hypothetical protein